MASFTILDATEADIDQCLVNSHAAFADDDNTLFKMHEQGTDDMASQMPRGMFGGYFPASEPPQGVFWKAVDNETGEILGHIMWGFWNMYGERPEGSGEVPAPLTDPIDLHNYPGKPTDASLPGWQRVSNISGAHLFTIHDRMRIPGKSAMSCRGITVRPDAQGRGIGSALVKRATELADEHHAHMWCHLSSAPGIVKTFEANGFKLIDPLTLDLDAYATKPLPEGREKWGSYTWSSMMRDAR